MRLALEIWRYYTGIQLIGLAWAVSKKLDEVIFKILSKYFLHVKTMFKSCKNSTQVTTAKLSWHVQIYHHVGLLILRWKQVAFLEGNNYLLINLVSYDTLLGWIAWITVSFCSLFGISMIHIYNCIFKTFTEKTIACLHITPVCMLMKR